MRQVLLFTIRLYPKRWRARYGGELEALLEDSKDVSARELIDLLKGAMKMRVSYLSRWKLVALSGLAGMVVMAWPAWVMQQTSRDWPALKIPINGDQQDSTALSNALSQAFEETHKPAVLRATLDRHGLNAVDAESLKGHSHLLFWRLTSNEPIFTLIFDYPDKSISDAIARDFRDQIFDRISAQGLVRRRPTPRSTSIGKLCATCWGLACLLA